MFFFGFCSFIITGIISIPECISLHAVIHAGQIQVFQVQVAQNELTKPRLRTFYLLMTAEVASVMRLVVS